MELLHLLSGYDSADVVSCISWSGDSKLLAVACSEQTPFDVRFETVSSARVSVGVSMLFFAVSDHDICGKGRSNAPHHQ